MAGSAASVLPRPISCGRGARRAPSPVSIERLAGEPQARVHDSHRVGDGGHDYGQHGHERAHVRRIVERRAQARERQRDDAHEAHDEAGQTRQGEHLVADDQARKHDGEEGHEGVEDAGHAGGDVLLAPGDEREGHRHVGEAEHEESSPDVPANGQSPTRQDQRPRQEQASQEYPQGDDREGRDAFLEPDLDEQERAAPDGRERQEGRPGRGPRGRVRRTVRRAGPRLVMLEQVCIRDRSAGREAGERASIRAGPEGGVPSAGAAIRTSHGAHRRRRPERLRGPRGLAVCQRGRLDHPVS